MPTLIDLEQFQFAASLILGVFGALWFTWVVLDWIADRCAVTLRAQFGLPERDHRRQLDAIATYRKER